MVSPPSMAGLPAPSAIVCVGPPLFASGPRRGLATVIPTQVESPNWRLCPPPKMLAPENEQLPPLLPAMVQLVTVTGAAERFSADPCPPAPLAVLPVKVSFVIVTLLPLLRFSTA